MLEKKTIIVLSAGTAFVLLYIINMLYFSLLPEYFTVENKTGSRPGMAFITTTISLIDNELTFSSGGWLPNDTVLSPTWLLDNKQNFQLGVLEVARYNTRVLRDGLSRQRSTDAIDADCDKAFTSFSNDPYKWIFPSAESKYQEGIERLENYRLHLASGSAYFYPRSDNLIQLLEQYASLLGGVNTRLLNASRTHSTSSDNASESSGMPRYARVPWLKIDDNFYFARGVGYGLYQMFKAVRVDFAQVLKDKNADIIIAEIIASLEETAFDPLVVTNGGKSGIFASHSSNLRVFLDDARQKINSLVNILAQG
jgi:hypothetical protein